MSRHHVEVHVAEGVEAPMEPALVERALRTVLEAECVEAATLSVAYIGDAEIAALNERFLGHEGPTDVISFELHEPQGAPHGDVYVGAEQANRQARELGIRSDEEWLRLAIHGTLHVLGYDHPEADERSTSPMYLRQEALLAQVLVGGDPT